MTACRVATVFGPSDEMPEAEARAMAAELGLTVVRDGVIEEAAESGERMAEMAATTTIETTEATTDKLALATTGLEPSSAAQLRALFVPFLAKAEEWETRAKAIVVTSIDQKREMKFARESRLALREIRCEVENARKSAKADALSRGKAVDGIANAIKGVIEPLEAHLQTQEDFARRHEAAEREKVRAARAETLTALGTDPSVYASLGEATDGAWATILETAQAAHDAKLEAARQAEAVRIEVERIAAERFAAEKAAAIKAEAERVAREKALAEEAAKLRAEAAEREAAAKVERERVEAERAAERAKAKAEADAREAAARAEREALEAKMAEERRQAQAEREAAAAAQRAAADRIAAVRQAETEKAAKLQAEAEAARVAHEAAEAARIAERAAEQAAIAKAQAEAAQAKADAERAAAEREAADVARAAAEAKSRAPTKAKYATLVAALEKIAAACTEEPACLAEDWDDYTFGGNFDDARAAGEVVGQWYAAEEAREALAAVGLGKAAQS